MPGQGPYWVTAPARGSRCGRRIDGPTDQRIGRTEPPVVSRVRPFWSASRNSGQTRRSDVHGHDHPLSVVGVPDGPDRGPDLLEGEVLGEANARILRPGVGVTDQLGGGRVALAVALPQRHPQRGHHQVGGLGRGRVPGHDPLGEHVEDERDVDEPGPRPDVDIPRESLSSRGGPDLGRESRPGGLFVPDFVVLQAPPHAAQEFVREVPQRRVVVIAGGAPSVVMLSCSC